MNDPLLTLANIMRLEHMRTSGHIQTQWCDVCVRLTDLISGIHEDRRVLEQAILRCAGREPS